MVVNSSILREHGITTQHMQRIHDKTIKIHEIALAAMGIASPVVGLLVPVMMTALYSDSIAPYTLFHVALGVLTFGAVVFSCVIVWDRLQKQMINNRINNAIL